MNMIDKAILAIRKLPPSEQEAIARELLDRIEADTRWEQLFDDPRSQSLLDAMAQDALIEDAAGRTTCGDPSDSRR